MNLVRASSAFPIFLLGSLVFESAPIQAQYETVVDVALDTPELNSFLSMLSRAGLTDTLMQDGPYTIFAPTVSKIRMVSPRLVES